MPHVFDLLTRLVGERPSSTFAALLVVHIAAGLTAVVAGATAMLSPKRSGRDPKAGRTYYTALCVLCATAVGMAAMHWPEDGYLVALGSLSLAAASLAYLARHYRWQGWIRLHILGMGTSYILLLTATTWITVRASQCGTDCLCWHSGSCQARSASHSLSARSSDTGPDCVLRRPPQGGYEIRQRRAVTEPSGPPADIYGRTHLFVARQLIPQLPFNEVWSLLPCRHGA